MFFVCIIFAADVCWQPDEEVGQTKKLNELLPGTGLQISQLLANIEFVRGEVYHNSRLLSMTTILRSGGNFLWRKMQGICRMLKTMIE